MPLSQNVVTYMLMEGTFADGAHFRSAFLCGQENDVSEHGWHSYDGLSGHKLEGCLPPMTPAGSRLSNVVYSLLAPEYSIEASRLLTWIIE